MRLLALLLLFGPAQAHDPALAAPALDAHVKNLSGFRPADFLPVIGDEAFLKRVMRDLVDVEPGPEELQAFVADPDPKKRAKKIDQLVADDRFAAFWAKRFEKVFFVDVEKEPWKQLPGLTTGRQGKAIEEFTAWLAGRLRADKPWTEIVRQMIDARGTLAADPSLAWLLSMRRGKGPASEFAESLALHLFGIRLRCARCHDHPYDKWTIEDYYGLAAFIARQQATVAGGDVVVKTLADGELKLDSGTLATTFGNREGTTVAPRFLYGGAVGKSDDRMTVLADLATARVNSQLPRALANRVWGWLLGAGVVNPVDDFNLRTRGISPALLEAMVKILQENNHSLKYLVRVVCNTASYQQPTPEEVPQGMSFRHAVAVRRVPRTPPAATSTLPLSLTLPQGWIRVREGGGRTKGLFLIPEKNRPGRTVELMLVQGRLPEEQWTEGSRQLLQPKKTSTTVVGQDGVKILFTEVTGTNHCRSDVAGPVEFLVWVAVVDAAKPLTFQAGAPAEFLADRRDEFIALLQSVSLK